jgi:hypothetical protein
MNWTELLKIGALGTTDKIANALDCANWLVAVDMITEEQFENLKKMCASEDKENAELAITIIEPKKHEYNLQRRGSQLQKY